MLAAQFRVIDLTFDGSRAQDLLGHASGFEPEILGVGTATDGQQQMRALDGRAPVLALRTLGKGLRKGFPAPGRVTH